MTRYKNEHVTAVTMEGRRRPTPRSSSRFWKRRSATGSRSATCPADKAYLSHDNLELVVNSGRRRTYRSSQQHAGRGGTVWDRCSATSRSTARTSISTTTSGRTSRARSAWSRRSSGPASAARRRAMKNEVLCKFLCHNIVVVNQRTQSELGIEPVFWHDKSASVRGDGAVAFPMPA